MHRPRVGERIMIEVLSSGESYAGEVQTMGDAALTVMAPAIRGVGLPVEGSPVRIFFVRKDGLYEEQGTITLLSGDPEPQLNVKLLGEVSRTQRRDYVRKDASLNAEIAVRGARMKCVTKDVSGGGISVLLGEIPPCAEGEKFDVSLNVPDGRPPIRATCLTKHIRETLRGSRWLIGSQFVAIAEEDRQRLVRFVFRLELAQKRPAAK